MAFNYTYNPISGKFDRVINDKTVKDLAEIVWTTLSNGVSNLDTGKYDFEGLTGSIAITLKDDPIGSEWEFSNADFTIGTNTVTIGMPTSMFSDENGVYQTGPLVLNNANDHLKIIKKASNRYAVVYDGAVNIQQTANIKFAETYNAATNTPDLTVLLNRIDAENNFLKYIVSADGNQDFGNGVEELKIGDEIFFTSATTYRIDKTNIELTKFYDGTNGSFEIERMIENNELSAFILPSATISGLAPTGIKGQFWSSGNNQNQAVFAVILESNSETAIGSWTREKISGVWGNWVKDTEDEWISTKNIVGTRTVIPGTRVRYSAGKNIELYNPLGDNGGSVRIVPEDGATWNDLNEITVSGTGYTITGQPKDNSTQEAIFIVNDDDKVWEGSFYNPLIGLKEWTTNTSVKAGDQVLVNRLSDGTRVIIERIANGTTRAVYDSDEEVLWTEIGLAPVNMPILETLELTTSGYASSFTVANNVVLIDGAGNDIPSSDWTIIEDSNNSIPSGTLLLGASISPNTNSARTIKIQYNGRSQRVGLSAVRVSFRAGVSSTGLSSVIAKFFNSGSKIIITRGARQGTIVVPVIDPATGTALSFITRAAVDVFNEQNYTELPLGTSDAVINEYYFATAPTGTNSETAGNQYLVQAKTTTIPATLDSTFWDDQNNLIVIGQVAPSTRIPRLIAVDSVQTDGLAISGTGTPNSRLLYIGATTDDIYIYDNSGNFVGEIEDQPKSRWADAALVYVKSTEETYRYTRSTNKFEVLPSAGLLYTITRSAFSSGNNNFTNATPFQVAEDGIYNYTWKDCEAADTQNLRVTYLAQIKTGSSASGSPTVLSSTLNLPNQNGGGETVTLPTESGTVSLQAGVNYFIFGDRNTGGLNAGDLWTLELSK